MPDMGGAPRGPSYFVEMISLLEQILAASGGGGGATWADFSGSIAVGGTSQQAIAANAARTGLFIQNLSSSAVSLFFNFGGAATVDSTACELVAGAWWQGNSTQSVNVIASAAGVKFIVKEIT